MENDTTKMTTPEDETTQDEAQSKLMTAMFIKKIFESY